MATYMLEHGHGCGFMGRILQRRSFWSRKSTLRALPTNDLQESTAEKVSLPKGLKKEQGKPVDGAKVRPEKISEKSIQKTNLVSPRVSTSQNQGRRQSDAARSSSATNTTSSSSSASSNKIQERQLSEEQSEVAIEPRRISTSHPSTTGILRASSGNILQLAQMSSLKQHGNETSPKKYLPSNMTTKCLEHNVTMGNILRRTSDEIRLQGPMNKLDPEELKSMGNERYKQGKYEEALALYDQAIALNSYVAAYRSNKCAALTALGRLLEAVIECKEAVRIDPSYQRAHHRLATLYMRVGCAEESIQHFSLSGSIANFKDINQAKALRISVNKCIDAKELKDWPSLLRETYNAFALGAESALQIYALQSQALLNLHRHDEAYAAFKKRPNFEMDSYTRLFGKEWSTYVYLTQAQLYMAVGRFEDAITAAQNAAQLNPSDKNVRTMVIKTQSVALARSNGNKLFKESKWLEACTVYSEGLEYDPYNSVLLCNRAACRSKLGQYEKSLEDCTMALSLQPSYSKARLRRAHCNLKMERWEASIQDYEILIREKPGDEEVGQALFEAQIQLKKQRGEDVKDMKFGTGVVLVSSIERFRHLITSPGMSVVLFCNKSNHEKALTLLEQVCLRFPSINFLKVEVEDHPYLAKSEAVSYIPAFKIYKNGSRVKDIPGNNLELLENSVKLYSS